MNNLVETNIDLKDSLERQKVLKQTHWLVISNVKIGIIDAFQCFDAHILLFCPEMLPKNKNFLQ